MKSTETPMQGLHLSNLLTYASVLVALTGTVIILPNANNPVSAKHMLGWVLGLCFVFDLFDGKFARLFKRRPQVVTEMGVQVDSLADTIAFGFVPAACLILINLRMYYKNFLSVDETQTNVFAFLCFVFVITNITRLAFFNARSSGTHDFIGLPTTIAAGFFLNLFLHLDWNPWAWIAVIATLSLAMVAPFRLKRPPLWVDLCLLVIVVTSSVLHFLSMIVTGK